jgi:L-threonylcarbamoyladenylate synthase
MPPLMPRVVLVDPRAPSAEAVAEATGVLKRGGLVGLPTETVYGLGARMFDERALERVFEAKGRPAHHPLIAHVLDERQARALASRWPEPASRLAMALWPGPLTLVVDRASHVPRAVAGGGDSIAVRSPSHPVARAVIAALGEPVAAPSANRYQGVSPTTAEHVAKELGDSVDLILDAGACEMGIESTVVDVRGAVARVLRPGAVEIAALRMIVAEVEAREARAGADEPRASPGMEARHYAPRARLLLAASLEEAQGMARKLSSLGVRAGLIVRGTTPATGSGALIRQLPNEPTEYARLLYRTLHELDDQEVDDIVVEAVPDDEAWWAIADRLRRAKQ